jgi:hypothetical protein
LGIEWRTKLRVLDPSPCPVVYILAGGRGTENYTMLGKKWRKIE